MTYKRGQRVKRVLHCSNADAPLQRDSNADLLQKHSDCAHAILRVFVNSSLFVRSSTANGHTRCCHTTSFLVRVTPVFNVERAHLRMLRIPMSFTRLRIRSLLSTYFALVLGMSCFATCPVCCS